MTRAKATTDEAIGRPDPWREGRFQQSGQELDQSVLSSPRALPEPPASKPVTRKDYEFPGQDVHETEDGAEVDPPGGDAG